VTLPGASAAGRVPATENRQVDGFFAGPRVLQALGQLPDLASREYDLMRTALAGPDGPDGSAGHVAAVETLGAYWAEQEHAAGAEEVPPATADAVEVVLDGLSRLPMEESTRAAWNLLCEDAAELADLRAHQRAGTVPRYATPADGQPVTAGAARAAMREEIAARQADLRWAAELIAGLRPCPGRAGGWA
jgi:hypothetical protein